MFYHSDYTHLEKRLCNSVLEQVRARISTICCLLSRNDLVFTITKDLFPCLIKDFSLVLSP